MNTTTNHSSHPENYSFTSNVLNNPTMNTSNSLNPSGHHNTNTTINTPNRIQGSTTKDRLSSLESIRNKESQRKKLHLYQELCASGKKQMFKNMLKNKLIESGWMDHMQELCNKTLSEKYNLQCGVEGGASDVAEPQYLDIDALAKELRKKGMEMLPEDTRIDMEKRLSAWIDEELMLDE